MKIPNRWLREQEEEEAANVFVSVKAHRDFIRTQQATQAIFLLVITCVLATERLANNRGTRVTLVGGFMQPHLQAYSRKLNMMDLYHKGAWVLR